MASLMSWIATWLGLKAAGRQVLEDGLKADLLVAGAVMQAHSRNEAEQYCRELESKGQKALAAEIRRQLQALSSTSASISVCGGHSATPDCLPALPGVAPPKQLPAPDPQKRKPGRPRKNPLPVDDDSPANDLDIPF